MALTSRNGPTDFLRGIFTNAFGELKKKKFYCPTSRTEGIQFCHPQA
jgi:hypothetical protein